MADVVVTVPQNIWEDWIAEGDAAGEPASGEEWGYYMGGAKPPVQPGDRVYIVACGALRGYAPLTRLVRYEGRWVLCREAGAVAVTIPEPIKGFRGWRRRWWKREDEVPFPEWRHRGGHQARFGSPEEPKVEGRALSLFDAAQTAPRARATTAPPSTSPAETTTAGPTPKSPAPSPRAVIPAAKLRGLLTQAGWPREQQQRLLDFLDACRRIPTPGAEKARGCPRFPVEVHPDRVVLIEAAWTYDPLSAKPVAKPIEDGHEQTFWRDDVARPWVRAVAPAQREAS